MSVLRFHCNSINTTQKNELETNRPVENAKKMKCYKRLICKQFVQISGLSGPQFLSFVWRRHIISGQKLSTNMAAGNQQKYLEFTFSIKSLPFHSRASIRAHKHTF